MSINVLRASSESFFFTCDHFLGGYGGLQIAK